MIKRLAITLIPGIAAAAISTAILVPAYSAPTPAPRHIRYVITYNSQTYFLNETRGVNTQDYSGFVAGKSIKLDCATVTSSVIDCGLFVK